MKSLLLLPFLVAVALASNHLDYIGQLAAGADGLCRFNGPTGIIDFSALPAYSNNSVTVSGITGYHFQLSACVAKNFSGGCDNAYAYLANGVGSSSSCFTSPPETKVNGTGVNTTAYTVFTSGQLTTSYLAVALATKLSIQYKCDPQGATDTLTLVKASLHGDEFEAHFKTGALCNLVPETTLAPPTTTAPVNDGDDGHKLSPWAIVGIIVGAVVVVVAIGVACWKCKSSNNNEDGEYRNVA